MSGHTCIRMSINIPIKKLYGWQQRCSKTNVDNLFGSLQKKLTKTNMTCMYESLYK